MKAPNIIYTVAWGATIKKLLKEVNSLLQSGWKLQGGVSHGGANSDYYQALYKNSGLNE